MNRTRPRLFSSARFVAALCALLLGASGVARAQQSAAIDVQKFRPNAHTLGGFTVDSPDVMPHLKWSVGFIANYADDPLYLVNVKTGARVHRFVSKQLTGDVLLTLGLFDILDIGVDLPISFMLDGEGLIGDINGLQSSGVGDLRLTPRVQILDGVFGLGIAGDLLIPTGDPNAFLGTGGVRGGLRLNMDVDLAFLQILFNLGAQFGAEETLLDLDVDHELTWGLGLIVPIALGDDPHKLALIGEVTGYTGLTEPFAVQNETGLEMKFGVRYHTPIGLALVAGGGFGVMPGYGTPDWRVFLGAQYDVQPGGECCAGFEECPDPDSDCDRLCDPWVTERAGLSEAAIPGCAGHGTCKEILPAGEGGDGRDEASCPLVCKGRDECPFLPEDYDGTMDDDGCPDPDNDGDRICDPWVKEKGLLNRYKDVCKGSDECPEVPEDVDGWQDSDGCPDPDNDGDKLCDPWVTPAKLDHMVQLDQFRVRAPKDLTCPQHAEELDKDATARSLCKRDPICRPASSGHGFLSDQCPLAPERYNHWQDNDGCPDSRITCEGIEIPEQIQFERGSAVIKPESFWIIEDVAKLLLSDQKRPKPRVHKIRVEGHTSDRWSSLGCTGWDKNMKLSQQRAEAVMAKLIDYGVPKKVLGARGFGWGQLLPTTHYPRQWSKDQKQWPKDRKPYLIPSEENGYLLDVEAWRADSRRTEFHIVDQDLPEGCSDPCEECERSGATCQTGRREPKLIKKCPLSGACLKEQWKDLPVPGRAGETVDSPYCPLPTSK